MSDHYLRSLLSYVDQHLPTDRCWDQVGFHPDAVPVMDVGDLEFTAASYCYDFFITNGLAGLLECEWGKMTPEFERFLRAVDCPDSAAILSEATLKFFGNEFPRNDSVRSSIPNNQSVFDQLDGVHSEELDHNLKKENFRDRLASYAQQRCEALGIAP